MSLERLERGSPSAPGDRYLARSAPEKRAPWAAAARCITARWGLPMRYLSREPADKGYPARNPTVWFRAPGAPPMFYVSLHRQTDRPASRCKEATRSWRPLPRGRANRPDGSAALFDRPDRLLDCSR